MAKAKNRFEIQIVFDDGASVRVTNKPHASLSRDDVFLALRKFLEDFDRPQK
jgi:hypothetical protein